MPLWNDKDQANNAPVYKGVLADPKAYGNAVTGNIAFNNVTSGAFVDQIAFGVFGVDATEASISGNGDYVCHSGWNTFRRGTGPVVSLTGVGGSGFATGETINLSNATSNGVAVVTANATGNIGSVSVVSGGEGWFSSNDVVTAFNRETHVANVTVTGTTNTFSNSDYVVVSNGTVNAVANVSTNSIGGISNSSFTLSNVGLFGNAAANSSLVVDIYAANGSASPGVGATLAAALATSTGGTLSNVALSGQAGRIMAETLVAMSGATFSTSTDSGNTVFPNA